MKKLSLFAMPIVLIMVLFSFNSCKKKATLPNCSAKRQVFRNLVNHQGTVFYYRQYNKFAVSIDTLIKDNIDTHINGLPCELPKEFQIEGKRVVLNGKLEKFNDGENFFETLGGEQLYFLKIDKITTP
ncbi:hypothetical protein ABIB40_002550 [Pedobacter sp. UYP30]|uniref:hypothetical protein n=1 Tax=Pedobacter sp. UYP30 TaxID=1756400 RepID=UPI003399C370